jgi:hypothetical protein
MNKNFNAKALSILAVLAVPVLTEARPIQVDGTLWQGQGASFTYLNPGNTLDGVSFCSNTSMQVWWGSSGQGDCGSATVDSAGSWIQLLSFDAGTTGTFQLNPVPSSATLNIANPPAPSFRYRIGTIGLPGVDIPFFGDISFYSAQATGGVAGDFDFSIDYGCLPFNGGSESNPCKNIVNEYPDLLGGLSSNELTAYLLSVEYGSDERSLVRRANGATNSTSAQLNGNTSRYFCYRQNGGNPLITFFGSDQCNTTISVPEPSTLALLCLGLLGVGMRTNRKLRRPN